MIHKCVFLRHGGWNALHTGELGAPLRNRILKETQEVWERGVRKNVGETTLQTPRSLKK